MTTFQVNQVYQCRSLCDYDCVWTFKVTKRTPATITLKNLSTDEVKTCRISKKSSEYFGCEIVHPWVTIQWLRVCGLTAPTTKPVTGEVMSLPT